MTEPSGILQFLYFSPVFSLCSPRLLQCGRSLSRTGSPEPSDQQLRRSYNVHSFLLHASHSGGPEQQVSTHPAAGAAVHAASRRRASGALHPAALYGERNRPDLHAAGSVRQEVLPGPDLLDGAAHDHVGPTQDGEEHRPGAAL